MNDGGDEWDGSRPQDGIVDKSVVKAALRELLGELPSLRGILTGTAGRSGDSVRRPSGDDQGGGSSQIRGTSAEGGERSMGASVGAPVSGKPARGYC